MQPGYEANKLCVHIYWLLTLGLHSGLFDLWLLVREWTSNCQNLDRLLLPYFNSRNSLSWDLNPFTLCSFTLCFVCFVCYLIVLVYLLICLAKLFFLKANLCPKLSHLLNFAIMHVLCSLIYMKVHVFLPRPSTGLYWLLYKLYVAVHWRINGVHSWQLHRSVPGCAYCCIASVPSHARTSCFGRRARAHSVPRYRRGTSLGSS